MPSGKPQPVVLCHKDKRTIVVRSPAVPAHLAHGDILGACEDSANGRVMCKMQGGKPVKSILVPESLVDGKLEKGWTLDECSPM